MTLAEVREVTDSYKTFSCDAKRFTGCLSYKIGLFGTHTHTFYWWCKICNYGYCDKCFKALGNAHHHTLTKMNLDQMKIGENWGYIC